MVVKWKRANQQSTGGTFEGPTEKLCRIRGQMDTLGGLVTVARGLGHYARWTLGDLWGLNHQNVDFTFEILRDGNELDQSEQPTVTGRLARRNMRKTHQQEQQQSELRVVVVGRAFAAAAASSLGISATTTSTRYDGLCIISSVFTTPRAAGVALRMDQG